MTMGPPQAEEALREALALGAQRAIHLSDRVFAVADTLGTSRTLAMAIEKEGADLVLCGRKALDSETWQVPSQVAAFLGWPHVTNVAGVERSGDTLRLTRQTDFGEEVYEAGLPVVVSVGLPPSRRPTVTRMARSRSGGRPTSSVRSSSTTSASARQGHRQECSRSATRGRSAPGSAPRRRRGGGEGAGPAGRASTRDAELGEAGPHRRGAGREVRLLECLRARGRPTEARLARVDRPQPRAGREARGARSRCSSATSSMSPRARQHSTAPRSCISRTIRPSPSTTLSSGPRSSAASSSSTCRASCSSLRPAADGTTARAPQASSSSE